jgi:hypothetical protein
MVQEHLFEPFVTTKSFGHLGLGLALASEIVRALDGTLSVSSCEGLGTTVLFSLPSLKAAEAIDRSASPLANESLSPDDSWIVVKPVAPHRTVS